MDDGGAQRRSLRNSDDVDDHSTDGWEGVRRTAVGKGVGNMQEEGCQVIQGVAKYRLQHHPGVRSLDGRGV